MKTGRFPPPGHQAEPIPFRRLNYDFAFEWVEAPGSLEALLAHLDGLRAADPSHRYLCTLDDTAQCSYTSGHARSDERLEVDAPENMDWDAPAELTAWELACLQHRVQQLANPELAQTWSDVCGSLNAAPEDIDSLVSVNADPDALLDEVVYIQRLPVPSDDLMIAGQPNGYFSCDWDTFQNHAVIRHLAAQWSYRFFGMGAAWMGFVRQAPLGSDEARHLVDELRTLYGSDQGNEVLQHPAWQTLEQLLQTQRTLLLGYTENMGDY